MHDEADPALGPDIGRNVIGRQDEDLDDQRISRFIQVNGEDHVVCLGTICSAPPNQPRRRKTTREQRRLGFQPFFCGPLRTFQHQSLDDVAVAIGSTFSDFEIQLKLFEAPAIGLEKESKRRVNKFGDEDQGIAPERSFVA